MSKGNADSRLKIYKSNNLESFLPQVFEIIDRLAKGAPLKKKSIVVQSEGMARWLTLKAAANTGAFANFKFVSPDDFLRNFADRYFGIGPVSAYNKKIAEWVLYSQLRNGAEGPAGSYIGRSDARAFRFSRTLADLFEQYFVYRPKMMESWTEGKLLSQEPDEKWQFDIFRELRKKTNVSSFAKLFNEKCEGATQSDDHPSELILFGISIMNSYHLNMFRSLSRLFPIHLFAVTPSREFYQRSRQHGEFLDPEENGGEFDTLFGRSCAASLDFLSFVLNNNIEEHDCFEEPEGKTLLSAIRKDILNDAEKPEKAAPDDSVKIISCRDKMREIEVLKDNLLELFREDDDLKPQDIAVMAPKINDYAPYITAVFGGTAQGDTTFIPWEISDRTFSSESRIAATFLEILRLARSDFEKSKVFSIFRSPFVCAKFNTDIKVAGDIEKLVGESGVRWGLDAGSRGGICVKTAQNTWDAGLSRIMMSAVMSFPEDGEGFEGILPMESLPKEDFDNISGFISFAKELFRYTKIFSSAEKMAPAEFKKYLEGALDAFFAYDYNDNNAREEIRTIRGVIDNFAETAAGQEIGSLSFDALLQYLQDELGRERSGKGFLSAKVNFCSLKPLRALPFKVICLIGMGENEFPRTENRYAFDLIQKKSLRESNVPLSRSVRDNDKYLFIEAVISAKQKLLISYESRDLSEDSKKHCRAAMPVQILEKYIEKKTGEKAEKLEIKYPVQPFSPEYFKEGAFKTFSKKDFEIAKALAAAEKNTAPNEGQNVPGGEAEQVSVQNGEPAGSTENESVDFEKLIAFFKDPIRQYLTKILKIALPEDIKEAGDEELFDYSADSLLSYNIRQTYINMAQSMPEKDDTEIKRLFINRMKSEGKMPFGAFGEAVLKEEISSQDLRNGIRALTGTDLGFMDFSLDFPEQHLKLQGRIQNIDRSGESACVIVVLPSKYKAKYKIEILIRHLVANACGLNADTYCFFNDKSDVLDKIDQKEAETSLAYFMELWRLRESGMPLFDPDLIAELAKQGDASPGRDDILRAVASFYDDKWLKRNDEHRPFPAMLLAAEQFSREEERRGLLDAFPDGYVEEIVGLFNRFFGKKKRGSRVK